MTERYDAIVVGCGSIGALKPDDKDFPGGGNILTHAHAFCHHPKVRLVGVVDADETKAVRAGKKWETLPYTGLSREMQADIVSVCVPTHLHEKVMREILALDQRPRMVICEKPFCSSLAEAEKISRLYAEQGIPIMVDYSRRFSTYYQDFARMIHDDLLGRIYHARLMYGRGLRRDGCHGIDLFNWMLGDCLGVNVGKKMTDSLKDDPTTTMAMQYARCENVQMVGVDSKEYGVFEMDLVTNRGRYVFAENGRFLQVFTPQTEQIYGSYATLSPRPTAEVETDLTTTIYKMACNAVEFLDDEADLLCGAEDAMKVHRIIKTVDTVTNERRN